MKIKQIVKSQEDGSYTAELQLTEEQTAFLLNFAIGYLVQQGTVSIYNIKDGEEDGEMAKEFLENIDPSKLHKA